MSPRLLAAEVLLIALVFFIHAGELVPAVNEAHYLGKAKHYWNPDWCPGDFFYESSDAHLVFYWSFGWVTRLLALPAAAWVGRILTWLLLALAWQRLSSLIAPLPFMSVLSAGLFVALTARTDLAGEWVVGGIEAKGFAYALVLFGLAALARSNWLGAGACLGAASAFHVLVGGWSLVALGFAWLAAGTARPSLRVISAALGAAVLLALPGLVPALALTWNQSPEVVADANAIYVFERLPHHLALLSLDPEEIEERFMRHGLALVVLAVVMLWANLVGRQEPWWSRLHRVSAFVVGSIVLAALGLLIEVAMFDDRQTAARVLRYYWYRLTDFAVPLGISLTAISVVAAAFRRRSAWSAIWLLLAMALPAWHLSEVTWQRTSEPYPASERPKKVRNVADWVDACDWILHNTPQNALFLSPRGALTFKWRTGRPEVVNRKDIPQDASGIVEWKRRMMQIHGRTEKKFGKGPYLRTLGHVGTDRIVEIATEYQADFLLTTTRKPLALPVVYQNNTFVVYRLPASK